MYQFFLKTNIVLIILFHNSLLFASLVPKNSHCTQIEDNYECINNLYQICSTYNAAIKNETSLHKVLTTRELLTLTDYFFDKSLPYPSLKCKSLHGDDLKMPRQRLDLLQKKRLVIFKALPKHIAQQEIYNQFQQIKECLLNDEYKAWGNLIKVFAQKYNFDSNIVISSYGELKNLTNKLLRKKHNNITHDETLPEHWVECIKNAMEKRGLDINNVNLFILESEKDLASCLNASINQPGAISLYKDYVTFRQPADLKFVSNHEVTHLFSGHGTIRYCACAYIKEQITANNTKKDVNIDNKIVKSPAYTSLLLAQERTADILCTLEDSNSAEIAYKYLSTYFDCSYSGSYNYAAIINANWKTLKLL